MFCIIFQICFGYFFIHRGIAWAPACGLAMSELILDGQCKSINLAPFDPSRFTPVKDRGSRGRKKRGVDVGEQWQKINLLVSVYSVLLSLLLSRTNDMQFWCKSLQENNNKLSSYRLGIFGYVLFGMREHNVRRIDCNLKLMVITQQKFVKYFIKIFRRI